MESRNISKVLSNHSKSKRTALGEVSNTQKSKESAIKRWLQSDTRDSDSSKETPLTIKEESEKELTQKTVIFNGTHEINIPTPRKVASPTKATWYLPRVVIPIMSPPEVTVNKSNFETIKSNESSLSTIKKNSKRSKSSSKKSQSNNNNNSLLNWFSPATSSKDQQSGSVNPQNDTNSTFDGENPTIFIEISSSNNVMNFLIQFKFIQHYKLILIIFYFIRNYQNLDQLQILARGDYKKTMNSIILSSLHYQLLKMWI